LAYHFKSRKEALAARWNLSYTGQGEGAERRAEVIVDPSSISWDAPPIELVAQGTGKDAEDAKRSIEALRAVEGNLASFLVPKGDRRTPTMYEVSLPPHLGLQPEAKRTANERPRKHRPSPKRTHRSPDRVRLAKLMEMKELLLWASNEHPEELDTFEETLEWCQSEIAAMSAHDEAEKEERLPRPPTVRITARPAGSPRKQAPPPRSSIPPSAKPSDLLARLRELAGGDLDMPSDIQGPLLEALDRIERPPAEAPPPPTPPLQLSGDDWLFAHPNTTRGKRSAMLNNINQINGTIADHWPEITAALNEAAHPFFFGADMAEVADWVASQDYNWWLSIVRSDNGVLPMRKHVRGRDDAGLILADKLNELCRMVHNDSRQDPSPPLVRTRDNRYRWDDEERSYPTQRAAHQARR